MITPKNNTYTKIEQKLTGMNIEEVKDFVSRIDSDVIKVILLQEPSVLKIIADNIKHLIPRNLNMTFSKPFFLEFTNKKIDKAVSVNYLANYLNISMKSVIAIGDSYNDISMVKQAGLGVAMANGVDAIKKVANYLTKSNMEDGVAEVIYRYILVEGIINSYNASTADSISA
jgi:Cof subfamily protein (haloacid dehalogenase superfamily)